jgi:hypothetical protein
MICPWTGFIPRYRAAPARVFASVPFDMVAHVLSNTKTTDKIAPSIAYVRRKVSILYSARHRDERHRQLLQTASKRRMSQMESILLFAANLMPDFTWQ